MLTSRNLSGTAERVIKILACCKLLNGLALKHHLPDLDMNSTVMTSSTVICALLASATMTMQCVVFNIMRIMETCTELCLVPKCICLEPKCICLFTVFLKKKRFYHRIPDLNGWPPHHAKPKIFAHATSVWMS